MITSGLGSLDATGMATPAFTLPARPAFIGTVLHWQALVGMPLRLTNAGTTRVSGL